MTFEVWYQARGKWAYQGTVNATDSRLAAKWAWDHHRKGVVGVRPECSNDKLYVYRFGHNAKKPA